MNGMLGALRCSFAGEPIENHATHIGDIVGRCSLPLWWQTLEFNALVGSRAQAIEAEMTHHNQRMILYDDWNNVVANTFITKASRDGRSVRYEMEGTGRLHQDLLYRETPDPAAEMTDTLEAVLNAAVPMVHVARANLAENATTYGALNFRQDGQHFFANEFVEALLQLSDEDGETYDYWCEPRPFTRGIYPQLDSAIYRKRSRIQEPEWYIYERDLVVGESRHSSDIHEYASKIIVYYGVRTGTTTHKSIDLIAEGVDFVNLGVRPGDNADNVTDGSTAEIVSIYTWPGTSGQNNACSMRLWGGTDNAWDYGDSWVIRMKELLTKEVEASNPLLDSRTVEREVSAPWLTETQAGQLANELLNVYGQPLIRQPLVIGSNTIYDKGGNPWPATMLMQRPSYVRVVERTDNADELDPNLTDRRGLFVVGADLDSAQGLVRIEPGHRDNRWDKLFKASGIAYRELPDAGQRPDYGGRMNSFIGWYNQQLVEVPFNGGQPWMSDWSHAPPWARPGAPESGIYGG